MMICSQRYTVDERHPHFSATYYYKLLEKKITTTMNFGLWIFAVTLGKPKSTATQYIPLASPGPGDMPLIESCVILSTVCVLIIGVRTL